MSKTRVSYALHPGTGSQHVSGVNALAIDFVHGSSSVLYSGGRDAAVNAWDLNIDFAGLRDELDSHESQTQTQTQTTAPPAKPQRKFSAVSDHISIPPRGASQLNYAALSEHQQVQQQQQQQQHQQQQLDQQLQLQQQQIYQSGKKSRSVSFFDDASTGLARGSWSSKVQPTVHSRSFQAHSDWVNDIILCNRNQSIVTCSNDRLVYLWSTTQNNMYMRLGYHTDHVKCLAYSSSGGWVASGGLDRRVMVWDTLEGREREIVGFSVSSSVFCHDKSPKASIYALACNPAGTTIVSGSPDKVVRVWDPRSGKQAIGLTGHRDNIRGLLVSDDGKWVVSASSDSTIKLWSLAHPQRCMVTYTHYEDSVYCLYSNHPDLDTFWAGGRDGLVTKMSRRRIGGDPKKGRMEDELVDCVAICKEDGPVHKLVAVDDMFVWTATNKSNINRWRDIPFRQAIVVSNRTAIPEESDHVYIPAASIIQQQRAVLGGGRNLNNAKKETGTINDEGKAGGLASDSLSRSTSLISKDAYSLNNASKFSVPLFSSSFTDLQNDGDLDSDEEDAPVEPVWLKPDHVIAGASGISKFTLMNNRIHVVTESTDGVVSLWDIVKCIKIKDFPKGVEFKDACDQANTFEWIAHWCTIDTKNGYLTIHLDESKFYEAECYYESVGETPPSEDQRVNIGKWVLSYLFVCYTHVNQQQIPPAAVMYHDHYFGALNYTNLESPADATSHYLFGQSVYYGPPELAFLDPNQQQQPPLQELALQQKPIQPSPSSEYSPKSPNASPTTGRKARVESLPANTRAMFSGTTTETGGEENENRSPPPRNESINAIGGGLGGEHQRSVEDVPPVRLRPRPLGAIQRPDSVIQVESALSHVQQIIRKPIPYMPNPDELPVIRIPADVIVMVSTQESPEAACYLDQFRSTVGQMGWVRETMRLHECMPRWVSDAIADKKLKDVPKMSFMMLPHPYSDLPELPNNANRLSSNRMIRLRKLLAYVAEQAKIVPPQSLIRAAIQKQRSQPSASQGLQEQYATSEEQRKPVLWNGTVNPGSVETLAPPPTSQGLSSPQGASTGTSPPVVLNDAASSKSGMSSLFARRKRSITGGGSVSSDSQGDGSLMLENWKDFIKPEEYLELCCQDKPLDPKMTLGTVKNLIWKSGGGDLTLTFRRKNV